MSAPVAARELDEVADDHTTEEEGRDHDGGNDPVGQVDLNPLEDLARYGSTVCMSTVWEYSAVW